ncbi:hypothetical protein D3C85_737360 [compost metagenome]
MTSVIKVWCEWDIGIEDVVYGSMTTAEKHVRQALLDCDIEASLEELYDNGLIGFNWIDVISE